MVTDHKCAGGHKQGLERRECFPVALLSFVRAKTLAEVRQAIRDGDFDVVHRVILLSLTAPSFLARRCSGANVAVAVGPLNGGVRWPVGFEKERDEEGEKFPFLRPLYKPQPGNGDTWRNASTIIVVSRVAAAELPESSLHEAIFVRENAVDPEKFALPKAVRKSKELKLCFMGRLVTCEGLEMALGAAQNLLRAKKPHFRIIGDGPLIPSLKDQPDRSGISRQVEFAAWVSHADIPSLAARSTIYFFRSIREFGGGAVIEAMALRLVPTLFTTAVRLRFVTPESGFLVKLGWWEALVGDAAALLTQIEGGHDLNAICQEGIRTSEYALHVGEKGGSTCRRVCEVCGKQPDRPGSHFSGRRR